MPICVDAYADRYNKLSQQSCDSKSDTEKEVTKTHPDTFSVHFFTAIKPNAEYLLVIHGPSGGACHLKLVGGNVLLACVTKAGGLDRSLQSGVYKYLKQYGKWVEYESLRVEVHKFDSTAIFEAEYEVKDEKVQ